jgi:hypothetical protein
LSVRIGVNASRNVIQRHRKSIFRECYRLMLLL